MEKTTCLPLNTQEGGRMNEIKENLRSIEQTYKIFQQQQFTFIAALEHTRENAHDKIKPVSSIGQVQTYTDHYCNNTTDKRILLMFLNICCELNKLCQKLESLHPGSNLTNSILDRCKTLVSHSNDLSGLRAKYPHDVVNHLSCDEARNHYGGIVSLIPVVLDSIKEWVAHTEKLPRNMLQSSVSDEEVNVLQEIPTTTRVAVGTGVDSLNQPTFHTTATQTSLTLPDKTLALERSRDKKLPVPDKTQAPERSQDKKLPVPDKTQAPDRSWDKKLLVPDKTQAPDRSQDKKLLVPDKTQAPDRSRDKKLPESVIGRTPPKMLDGPWRPPGRHNH